MSHPIANSMRVASALGDPLVFLCPAKSRSFDGAKQALARQLASMDGQIVLVVDGVSGTALMRQLTCIGHEARPLFPQDADEELLDVSPVLFAVEPSAISDVFETFWGQGIASLFVTQSSVDEARDHLSAAMYAETDTGEICIIRLHDPRALIRISDVFDTAQREALFKDIITEVIFEGPKGEILSLSPMREDDTLK